MNHSNVTTLSRHILHYKCSAAPLSVFAYKLCGWAADTVKTYFKAKNLKIFQFVHE